MVCLGQHSKPDSFGRLSWSGRNKAAAAVLLETTGRHESIAQRVREATRRKAEPAAGEGIVDVELLQAIGRLATSEDVPQLIALLPGLEVSSLGSFDHVMPALAKAIARAPWESHQIQLISLLAHPQPDVAAAAAHVLASRPAVIDVPALVTGFDQQPPRTRRLYCRLLGRATDRAEARDTVLRAMRDDDAGVRYESVSAVYAVSCNDERSATALASLLDDPNRCVAAGAALTLGKLGATEAAPILLDRLKRSRQSSHLSNEEWGRQAAAVSRRGTARSFWPLARERLPDYFPPRLPQTSRQHAGLFCIFSPKVLRDGMNTDLTFDRAVIIALGQLHFQQAGEFLLSELSDVNHNAAIEALQELETSGTDQALLKLALDDQAAGTQRGLALNSPYDLSCTNRVHDLLPLLDETTVILTMRPGSEWRLCDQAAVVMAKLLDWDVDGRIVTEPARRDELIQKLRHWAATQPK